MARTPIQPHPYRDTVGKRDITKNMLTQHKTVAEICRTLCCTRDEADQHYGDLLAKYHPAEYTYTEEDRLLVWRSVAYGMTTDQIAYRLGISVTCLATHFRRELTQAKEEWVDDIATSLVKTATAGVWVAYKQPLFC